MPDILEKIIDNQGKEKASLEEYVAATPSYKHGWGRNRFNRVKNRNNLVSTLSYIKELYAEFEVIVADWERLSTRGDEEIFEEKNKEIGNLKEENNKLYDELKKKALSEEDFNAAMDWYHHHIVEETLKNGPADICNHKLKFAFEQYPIVEIKSVDCSCGASHTLREY